MRIFPPRYMRIWLKRAFQTNVWKSARRKTEDRPKSQICTLPAERRSKVYPARSL